MGILGSGMGSTIYPGQFSGGYSTSQGSEGTTGNGSTGSTGIGGSGSETSGILGSGMGSTEYPGQFSGIPSVKYSGLHGSLGTMGSGSEGLGILGSIRLSLSSGQGTRTLGGGLVILTGVVMGIPNQSGCLQHISRAPWHLEFSGLTATSSKPPNLGLNKPAPSIIISPSSQL